MARAPQPVDISAEPTLVRLAEDVATSGTPRLLRRDGEDVAVLMPLRATPILRRRTARRKKTEADHEAFLASAGGWADLVDSEQLKADIAASRAASTRPPIEL